VKVKLLQVREASGITLCSPVEVAREMQEEGKADRECFWCLHLNTKNRIIEKEIVAIGNLNCTTIHPREVFRKAVLNSSCSLITVHNHPSGDPTPSEDDKKTWAKLKQAGDILGIEVIDNIIISPSGRFYSEKEGR
jgi:DNA repair protein RadC